LLAAAGNSWQLEAAGNSLQLEAAFGSNWQLTDNSWQQLLTVKEQLQQCFLPCFLNRLGKCLICKISLAF
jgi:hypothetical protein